MPTPANPANSPSHGADQPAKPSAPGQAIQTRPLIRSGELLGQAQSVNIEHQGQIYCLQTTRAGKLILTK